MKTKRKDDFTLLFFDVINLKRTAVVYWIKNILAKHMISQINISHNECENRIENEKEAIKNMLENNFQNLSNSIKGGFGNRIIEALEAEYDKIERL